MIENIDVFSHNCIRIRGKELTVYVDPFQMKETPRDADYIFVTHDHFDHFSPDDIEKVSNGNAVLVLPERMADKAREVSGSVSGFRTVTPGSSFSADGMEVEAVPAYNIGKPFHPKSACWVGYLLTIDGTRIYIAGDTDDTPEARLVKCDIALIPVGGTYTMDNKQAAAFVNALKPSFVIPTHYGSVVGGKEDGKAFASQVKEPVKVVLKI